MKYYVPELKLAALSPPQTQAMDKFGGLPWGLPAARWPHCAICKRSMALIAQFFHHEQRLDLGAPGRCLFVFMCSTPESPCGTETFDPASGTNAGFVLEPHELDSGGLTWPPDAQASWPIWSVQCCGYLGPGKYGGKVWINVEARVTGWREQEDGIDSGLAKSFRDYDGYWNLPEGVRMNMYAGSKLGGAPCWLQGPPDHQAGECRAQFAGYLSFPPPLPSADEIGCTVTVGHRDLRRCEPKVRRFDVANEICAVSVPDVARPEGSWGCGSANYGNGIAYVLLQPNGAQPPKCAFLWQC